MILHHFITYLLCLVVLFLSNSILPFFLSQNTQNDKARSSITYKLVHRLHTVYGTSSMVSSDVDLRKDKQAIKSVKVTVPVKSFDSGNSTRDKEMLKVTDAALYPEVQFQSTSITPVNGEIILVGKLTFHGVTKSISFKAKQQLNSQNLLVDGQFVISLEDYNIKRPSIFGMKVKDELTVSFYMAYPLAY